MRPRGLYRQFTSQADLDAQYDTSRATPDAARQLDRFQAESERARSELDCRLDVPYGPTRPERLDYFPASPEAPLLVFIHGGYWRARSARDFSFVARGPVRAGVSVAVVEYALCPQVSVSEIVRQCRAAVAWLHCRGHEQINVTGHSAGGHLVGMLLATDWEADWRDVPGDVIRSACTISGLFDLAPFPYTWLQPALQLTWEEVVRLSPLYHLPDRAGPLLVSYGGRETAELRRQSEDFLAAWRARALDGELLVQAEADHYSAIWGLSDPDSPLCRALLRQVATAASSRSAGRRC
jgi:arylformamidase